MKRALRIFLIFAALSAMLMLVGCKDDEAPDGMRLVRGGSDVGYYFYGPEEWTVANLGDIACTYVSKIDTTSVTFTETVKLDMTNDEYFNSEAEKFNFDIKLVSTAKNVPFGSGSNFGDEFVYTYEYGGYSYTTRQIFVTNADRFYIFTYTASNQLKTDDTSAYSYYMDKVNLIIENFSFTDKTESQAEDVTYERDSDGYILISDESICSFKLYVPDAYKPDYSSMLVCASRDDGSYVTVSTVTYTSVTVKEYINTRISDIKGFADKTSDPESGKSEALVEVIKSYTEETDSDGNTKTTFSFRALTNGDKGIEFEYKYTLDGTEYHVYQVYFTSGQNAYMFTYTAEEENYESHLEEANTILDKIEY